MTVALKNATWIADSLGLLARESIEEQVFQELSPTLGAADRTDWLYMFFSDRDKRYRPFFESLGLQKRSDTPYDYGPGRWRLRVDDEELIVSDIRNSRGSARMSLAEFSYPDEALAAILAVAGDAGPSAPRADWRWVWSGFSCTDLEGGRHASIGVSGLLLRQFADRGEA